METLKARRSWTDILWTLRDHRCQSRLLDSKLSIIIDEERKAFHDKIKFNQCLPTNLALQKALEGKLTERS